MNEALAVFVVNRNSAAGYSADVEKDELKAAAIEEHLTYFGVHPTEYKRVYMKSVDLYEPYKNKGPYGIDYILQAIKEIQRPKMVQDYTEVVREETNCMTCRDTGWKLNGLMPITEVIEGKKYRVRCNHEH